MEFIGVLLRTGGRIHTDDYDQDEIRRGLPFKNLVKDLIRYDIKEPLMVYDTNGRFYKTLTQKSYTPIELQWA